ncbi:MAG: biosynthetic arginine decarboxylase [Chromatiales bacterium]|nr:biosynthetic arginine decarboxylase [Chromatiales bacterium]
MTEWNIQQAQHCYSTAHWGGGYFGINGAGHACIHPLRDPAHAIDFVTLAAKLQAEGLSLPVLLRFNNILHDRVDTLTGAFDRAMSDEGYRGRYTAVYPIKVNQQRSVVEEIVHHGGERVGLEAGSKPELMAVLAMVPRGGTIVCNGYKDREYIRLALIGRAMGHQVYIVVEKPNELQLVQEESAALGIEPLLGVRLRLASIGAGNWQNTGGEKSKFGLSAGQVLQAVETLRAAGQLGHLKLMHVHLGSQLANIRDIQRGVREVGRFYSELRALGVDISVVDLGGGLGIDYEGSRSRSACSMNYSVEEYANNIVHTLYEVCSEHGLPHPDIVTESGRALTAHHAVLMTNVVDVERVPDGDGVEPPAEEDHPILHDMWYGLEHGAGRPVLELYHDTVHWQGEAQSMFLHGVLNLKQRALAEHYFFALCRVLERRLQPGARAHREALDELHQKLADKLFVNFSLFQSLPDIWGIEQVFPIMPLQRLDEPPTRHAVLEDLTCDSDGRVDHYVDSEGVEGSLRVHDLRPGEPYLVGFFLVGAYQEILGDMHNLFGDTDSVNVVLDGAGGYRLENPERGDTVDDLLRYVHFDPPMLMEHYREKLAACGLSEERHRHYLEELQAGIEGYTYFEE